jgi:hypothetical protein
MTLVSEDKQKGIARLGVKGSLISLRQAATAGTVDHFAISVEGIQRGGGEARRWSSAGTLRPAATEDSGFHVKDPDGANVQLCSRGQT